jgi:SOS response associated peptidase (SRAP)
LAESFRFCFASFASNVALSSSAPQRRATETKSSNALADTIAEKRMFSDAYARRRCIVPMDVFPILSIRAGSDQIPTRATCSSLPGPAHEARSEVAKAKIIVSFVLTFGR